MTDKKNEWEIGDLQENPVKLNEVKTVNFQQSNTLVGQMLDGRFLIEKDLTEGGADKGGIGLVYLAKDMKLMGKKTVVKILQQTLLQNLDIARKFKHEKEALIRLDHPNIIRILDSGYLSDGNPFMVMEYIAGYSLRRKLRETGKLPLDYCAHLIESVTNALSTVHAQQILHRDIKPENIMLTPQKEGYERICLIDFGIARVENSQLAPLTAVERAIGTILYIAPEQLAGTLKQTPAVDIYAFAIVTYEMLTGNLPFKPQSMVEMYNLQKEGVKTLPSDLRPDLPKEAEKILLSALAFNPQERPQNVRAFGRDLAAALRTKANFANDNKVLVKKDLAKTVPADTRDNPIPLETAPSKNPPETIPKDTPGINGNSQSISQVDTLPSVKFPENNVSKAKGKWVFPITVLAAISLIIAAVIFFTQNWRTERNPSPITNNNTSPSNETTSSMRRMRYWLEVQKMRDGQKFDSAFESSGREILEKGYQIRLNFRAEDDGYFYLFNEGKDSNGKTNYNIIYPIPIPGKDSAKTEGETIVQTDWSTVKGKAGTENMWLIWTKDEQAVLKDAAKEAFNYEGKVIDYKKEDALRNFLDGTSKQQLNTELEKDDAKRRTVLSGKGDNFAYILEIEHR